jgi:uncharacterized membrane protein YbaN (DUF454 family)
MTADATPGPSAVVARSRISRVLYFSIGWVCVGLGSLGVVVPGLPTTIFFIVAASCFARSSPRFERWVLDLPRIGPMVRDHRAGLGMPRRAKVIALAMMWVSIAVSAWFLRNRPPIVAVVVLAAVVGTVYICWRVPTRERVLATRGLDPAS